MKAHAEVLSLLTEDGSWLKAAQIHRPSPASAAGWSSFPSDAAISIADVVRAGKPVVLEYGALVAVPILHRTRALGGLGLGLPQPRRLDEGERAFLLALADLCGQALELAEAQRQCRRLEEKMHLASRRHQRKEQEMRGRQQKFLRDVLASVTAGRLRLCAAPGDLPPPLISFEGAISLSAPGGIRDLRRQARQAAEAAGLPPERGQDLDTAVGEAGLNAVTHARGGVGRVSVGPTGTVQIRVEEQGTGIALEHLPHATLTFGWSSKASAGHGFKMILQTADRVHLLTRATGTRVVLEQDRDATERGFSGKARG